MGGATDRHPPPHPWRGVLGKKCKSGSSVEDRLEVTDMIQWHSHAHFPTEHTHSETSVGWLLGQGGVA